MFKTLFNSLTGRKDNDAAVTHKDPICGMSVEEGGLTALHEGKAYHFCSAHCQQEFNAHPGDYAH